MSTGFPDFHYCSLSQHNKSYLVLHLEVFIFKNLKVSWVGSLSGKEKESGAVNISVLYFHLSPLTKTEVHI